MKSDPLVEARLIWVPAQLCAPLPAPAQLGLPVCHRESDVPSYHLWGSVREICGERGQVRQAEGALLGTACACDLLSQTSQARAVWRPTMWQRDSSLNLHLIKTETAR